MKQKYSFEIRNWNLLQVFPHLTLKIDPFLGQPPAALSVAVTVVLHCVMVWKMISRTLMHCCVSLMHLSNILSL